MNRLVSETSPYLRQHVDNPVDWYPWGDEAFAAARERDVPVILSIGYSACHWCHVMAHECFEDDEVAARMNAGFVSIKVDREERPDVDAVYMAAVQALTGRGGWPMTVALDHDRRPFWGGTYLPKPQFMQLLDAIAKAWTEQRDELDQNATAIVRAIDAGAGPTPKPDVPPLEVIDGVLQKVAGSFDAEWGGFGPPPKFPAPHHLQLVMRAFMTSGSDDAKRVVTTTLDAMASGGMYDHVGGGFARYSTDERWHIPHFEKMLTDQALLVRTYREAYSLFAVETYRQVVEETIEYVLRDLRHPDGGFFAAEDADAPDEHGRGVEGLFQTWTPNEVRAALAGVDDAAVDLTLQWWGITDEGDVDGRALPNRLHARGQLRRPPTIDETRQRLLDARSRRPRPSLDDQIITEWNAMFTSALADAAAMFRRDDWAAAAVANGEFLLRTLRDDRGRWSRAWNGRPRHGALAADHAALLEMFVKLSELTGERRWIEAACATADTMLDHFWDPSDGGLFTTPDDGETLVVRQKDVLDTATPSANSSAAHGLLRLAARTGDLRYRHHADRILQLLGSVIEQSPGAVSNALLALELRHRGLLQVAIAGDAPALVKVAQVVWRPDVVLAWGEPDDSPLWQDRRDGFAYVCRDAICELPISDAGALYERLIGRPLPEGMTIAPDG